MKKVLILDFGGQYNLLVARRVRECGVYCELKSFRISMDEVREVAPPLYLKRVRPRWIRPCSLWASRCWASATGCS